MLRSLVVCTLFFVFASAMPHHLKVLHEAAKSGEFMYGDIKLTERQKTMRLMPENARSKLFISEYARRWPNAVVPVTFARNITQANQRKIRKALQAIESKTCFRFPDKKPSHKDYIQFIFDTSPNSPCWSALGRMGGMQPISLVQGCIDDPEGTVGHEVMHALGVEHEHQRPDRDNYIDVDPSWADSGPYAKIQSSFDLSRFPYDTKSVMHYEGFEIQNEEGRMIKMLYHKGTDEPVRRNHKLSDEDVRKLNELGNCSGDNGAKQNTKRQPAKRRQPKKSRRKSG